MSGKRSSREEGTGRGRHRGEHLDASQQLDEDKAKGHTHPDNGEPGLSLAPDPQGAWETRGHQKGYGANQEDEGETRQTRRGTRAPGAQHG